MGGKIVGDAFAASVKSLR